MVLLLAETLLGCHRLKNVMWKKYRVSSGNKREKSRKEPQSTLNFEKRSSEDLLCYLKAEHPR